MIKIRNLTFSFRQPWAIEMLVKVLRQAVSTSKSSIFMSSCHADLRGILPEMAQLQWTLTGNTGIQMIISCPSCQYLAVLTLSRSVYVINQDGFVTPMKYQKDKDLKDLVWSVNQDESGKIINHDLIGFSDTSIYIWDPVHGGEAMELNFSFDTETTISCLDASQMSLGSLFVVGTSSGKLFTPATEMTPVPILEEEISFMQPLPASNKIIVASKKGNIVLVHKNQDELKIDQCLSKHFETMDGIKVFEGNEDLIVAWSKNSSDLGLWSKSEASQDFWSLESLPHPCKIMDVDLKDDLIAVAQSDGGVAIWKKLAIAKFGHDQLLWGHGGQSVKLIKFHPNGDLLATGSQSLVNIWSLSTGTVIQTVKFESPEGPPVSMTWLGHRRLTIGNGLSNEITVLLMPTNYDQEFNMDNVKVAAACRKALMEKSIDLFSKTVCLKYLLSHLASLIQLQKINEASEDRSLLASPFMRSLVSLSEVFSLDTVFETSEVLSVDMKSGKMIDISAPKDVWYWMISAIRAIRELNNLDKTQADENAELIHWVTENPLDWQLGGACGVFTFGRKREGQLGDANIDHLDPDGQLPHECCGQVYAETQQIVCGKNATFFVKFNGDVYSCGEGSNGRLGHGNSDDLQSPNLITGMFIFAVFFGLFAVF